MDIPLQSEDKLTTRLRFALAFVAYYALKMLSVKVFLFPEMNIRLFGCILRIRRNTLDFWVAWSHWEEEITNYLVNHPEEKCVFIDVGAHIGRYSVIMAKKAWEVYSFEPLDSNFARLKLNVEANGVDDRIKLYRMGLGREKEYHTIFFDENRHAEASIFFQDRMCSEKVFVNKLDSVLQQKFSCKVVLKIDVEGFECEVLEGARDFIKWNTPEIIIEISSQNTDAVFDFLNSLGYGLLRRCKDAENYIFAPHRTVNKNF